VSTQTANALGSVLAFTQTSREKRISYVPESVRDAIMVRVAVPGERWEIEFFEGGAVEIDRFVSTGVEEGTPQLLEKLIADNAG
jgi:hypothetical protein